MRFLKVNKFKTIAALSTMVFFMSCTDELVTTTGGLIDNDNFLRETISVQPILKTEVIDTVRTNLMDTYLLGEYTDPKLGTLKSTIVSEIFPQSYSVFERTSAVPADDVITSEVNATIEIPLTLISKEDTTEESEVNNLIGNVAESIDVTVSTFKTYLEQFNENGNFRIYYSNGKNNASTKEDLGEETIIGTMSDVFFLKTYTEADTLRINLDNTYFDKFLNDLDGLEIDNNDEFKALFKGLKISATKNDGEGLGLAVPLDLSNALLKIAYKNTNTSLNTEEEKELVFNFSGVTYNLYEHDHMNSGELNKTYVQGAGGYETSIDISSFIDNYSDISQDENWLINQARIRVYLDGVEDQTLQSFYAYGIGDDNSLSIIDDYITLDAGSFNGFVFYEDAENEINPYIEFYITDFIQQALQDGEIANLRIKPREASEDTGLILSSSIPKGALLLNDLNSDKAPVFEVTYSRLK